MGGCQGQGCAGRPAFCREIKIQEVDYPRAPQLRGTPQLVNETPWAVQHACAQNGLMVGARRAWEVGKSSQGMWCDPGSLSYGSHENKSR